MPKYRIRVEYVDHVTYQGLIWIQAESEEQAVAQVKDLDDLGHVSFREVNMDTQSTEYTVAEIAPLTHDERAMADLTAAYFGEG